MTGHRRYPSDLFHARWQLIEPILTAWRAERLIRFLGIDAAKKVVGRKRSIAVATLGLLLAVLVAAASALDSVAGTALIDHITVIHPGIRTSWGDGGYRQHLVEHGAVLGIDMRIVRRAPSAQGFTVLPRR